jgi:hypothetical protein
VVNAIAHIHVKPPRLTKQRFVAGGAAAVAVAGRVVLRIRLGFHKYAPEQLATFLAFHKQAANQLGGDELGRAGEEGLREGRERAHWIEKLRSTVVDTSATTMTPPAEWANC